VSPHPYCTVPDEVQFQRVVWRDRVSVTRTPPTLWQWLVGATAEWIVEEYVEAIFTYKIGGQQ
jgi:hypothetical protein